MNMDELRHTAKEIRKGIIDTVYAKQQGHLGGPLSVADILTALYFYEMRIGTSKLDWVDRDRFILSKGHSAIALYVTLAKRGYFPYEELLTFDEIGSRLQAHPDMTKLPGLDMSTGSLGQGLSVGVGMAIGAKRLQKDFRVYVVIGDGESQEGQIWEAADVARKYQLDNLIAILDWNQLQQFGWAGEDGKRQPPDDLPAAKWKAFGWDVVEVDGHDLDSILYALDEARHGTNDKPKMLIARTVKGKGISFMEDQYEWHSKVPTEEEWEKAMKELEEA
jgi:transketolase